jgi:NitT/TauT family transport system substrate-binding protein
MEGKMNDLHFFCEVKQMKHVWLVGLLVGLVVGLMGCGGTGTTNDAAPEALTKIRLPMGYIPDPQYAPLYVATEKGYYAEEGLEIEFDYSFETDGIALVGANELPLAIVSGEQVILARAQNLPVVYVMEWFQKYPVAIVSKTEAGISTPEDLIGRNVGLPGFFGASYVGYVGLLHANGLTEAQVNANDIGFTQLESLLVDQSEAVVVYINNEPVQLAAQGVDINTIAVADYIDLVANGIITNEETLANNPALVEGFVRATLRGLADTLADPEAAFETSKQFVEGLDDGRYPVLLASIELWRSDMAGQTDPASWQLTHDVLLDMGFLDAPLDNLEAAFTNEIVEKAR